MGSKDTKTGESEPEETVFFFDGLAKAPSLIKRAAEETETLGGEKKSVDVVELAKEGLETIIEAIHVYKTNLHSRMENEETAVIMASEDSTDGNSRGKKDKKILHMFGGKAASLLGRAKEDAEKAVNKVKDKAKEGIQSKAEKVADKVFDSAERAKGGIENIKDLFHKKQSDHDQETETENAEEDNKEKTETGETSKSENVVGTIESVVAFIQPKKQGDNPPPEKKDGVPSIEEEKESVPPTAATDIVPVPATEKEDFWQSLGKWLENFCSIFKSKKD